ncbi:MAG: CHAT domain-containing protein [Myxococcota bacterium]
MARLPAWRLLLFGLAVTLPHAPAPAQTVTTDLIRDPALGGPGAPVATPLGEGTLYEIGESLGAASGANLFHAFTRFDVGTGDTVRFTADPGSSFRNVITRITGGPAHVDGTIESTITGADFYFLAPHGVVFGENARIDVPASFYASSADYLRFADGSTFDATGATGGALSPVDPARFGFFDDGAGAIESRGRLEVGDGQRLALVGGDIRIAGGEVFALGGEVDLVSVASGGEVAFDAVNGAGPTLSGVTRRGDVALTNDAIVSSSGLSPAVGLLNAPGDLESRLVRVRVEPVPADEPYVVPDGATVLSEILLPNGMRQIRFFVTNDAAPARTRAAGSVRIQADDLTLVDADIESVTVGAAAGEIAIDLTGDLTIEQRASAADSGIFARTGVVAEGYRLQLAEPVDVGCGGAVVACRVIDAATGLVEYGPLAVNLTGNTGSGGDVTITARDVRLIHGGRIASSSLSGGSPGDIRIEASGAIELTGATPFPSPDPNAIPGSAIATNHQGVPIDAAGRAGGTIALRADTLTLRGPSGVFAQTSGDGDAGDIDIDVRRLALFDAAVIDSSTSGQTRAPDTIATGEGGRITVVASESVLLAGQAAADDRARLSTLSQAASAGGAGSIHVTTPRLELRDGAAIAVTTFGEGTGGDIALDVDRLEMHTGASLSARSESTTRPAGDIAVAARQGVRLDGGSQVDASTGIATGGNVLFDSGAAMVVGDGVGIRAEAAILGGTGGRVEIDAPLLVRAPSSVISAAAPGGPDVQGEVAIHSPVVFLKEPVRPPAARRLDASALLLSRCAARAGGDRSGRFEIATWPGLPADHQGPLLAFEAIATEPTASSDPPSERASIDLADAMAAGGTAFRGGRAEEAARLFARAAEVATDSGSRSDALRGLGQALELAGDYESALAPLERAVAWARAEDDAVREAAALGQLGNAQVAMGELERAERTLETAVARARAGADPEILVLDLNHLGNLRARQGRLDDATALYDEAAGRAAEAGDALRTAQSLANQSRVALERGDDAAARAALDRAHRATLRTEPGVERLALLIHVAEGQARLARRAPPLRRALLVRAHRLLVDARAEAGALGDAALRAQALGALGALYEEEGGREREALYLTRRALEAAETARAPMLVARWSVQAARLARAEGRDDEALEDDRRAVAVLDAVHPETRARYGGSELGFQRAVEPVYLALVDVLLRRSETHPKEREALLREARDTVERWKGAELRDYFRDDCVAALEARTRPLEQVDPHVAVVYPILLDDRLELLVTTPRGMSRHVVPVAREAVAGEVEAMRELLRKRTTSEFRSHARTLHEWLVAPYAERLATESVTTLVFIPDRILRTIPMGALHDGETFLIERFAVAVTPTLELLAPRRLDPRETRFLLAGVSEPVQGFDALEHVPEELRSIQARFGGELLLDEGFRADRFGEAIRERHPGVVHIASHAWFGGDARESYVVTHDGRLDLATFSRLMASSRFSDEPVELLLLSACETAAGDERAALGLAGIAVQAGVRSALGSLWRVDDEATARLLDAFYAALAEPGTSKAEAFAHAQRSLLGERRFRHPYYWAGFMVINNWL